MKNFNNKGNGDFKKKNDPLTQGVNEIEVLSGNKEIRYKSDMYVLGGVLCANFVFRYIVVFIISYVISIFNLKPDFSSDTVYLLTWLSSVLFNYALPMLLFYAAFHGRDVPKDSGARHSFHAPWIIPLFFSSYFMTVIGAYITQIIYNITIGESADNVFSSVMPENLFQRFVFYAMILIVAPLSEEFIFRKLLMAPLRNIGDLPAILITSLFFALSHGNLTQAPYAFLCGLILGFAAVWTNTLIIPVIIHISINGLELLRSELARLIGEGALNINGGILDISFFLIVVLGAISIVFMAAKGIFKFENTSPEISAGRKAIMTFLNPLMLIALALIFINMK